MSTSTEGTVRLARRVAAVLWDTLLVVKTRSVLFFTFIALAAALAGALVARQLANAPLVLSAGTWLPQSRPVAPFQLTDQDGAPFDQASLEGAPSLLFFGFTHCPDVCPTTLALLAQLDHDPPVKGLRTILVTVDPERDDVAAMKRYVGAFSPRMLGLTGTDEQIDVLLTNLGAARMRTATVGGGYTVDHSATVYLLDRDARLVAVFTPPLTLPALRSDLALASRLLEP
jgi:protein SCO1/2